VQFQLCVVDRPTGNESYHASFTAPLIELYEHCAPEVIIRCRFDCTSEALFCLLKPTLLALLCLNPKTCKLILLDNFLVVDTNGFGAFGTHTRIVQTLERSRLRKAASSYASRVTTQAPTTYTSGAAISYASRVTTQAPTTYTSGAAAKTCCYEPDHQPQCALSFSTRVLEPTNSSTTSASNVPVSASTTVQSKSNQRQRDDREKEHHKDGERIKVDDDDDFPTQVCTYLVRFSDGCSVFTTKVRTGIRVRETSVCHLDSKESHFNWMSQKFGWLASSPVISLLTSGACMGISRKLQGTVFHNNNDNHNDNRHNSHTSHSHRSHSRPHRRRHNKRIGSGEHHSEPFHNVLRRIKDKYNNVHPALQRHEKQLYGTLLRPFL